MWEAAIARAASLDTEPGFLHTLDDKPETSEEEYAVTQLTLYALALAEELGMRPLSAHCHLGLGTLYRKLGRLAQGRSELSAASELYCAMDMMFWLSRAEASRAQVG